MSATSSTKVMNLAGSSLIIARLLTSRRTRAIRDYERDHATDQRLLGVRPGEEIEPLRETGGGDHCPDGVDEELTLESDGDLGAGIRRDLGEEVGVEPELHRLLGHVLFEGRRPHTDVPHRLGRQHQFVLHFRRQRFRGEPGE
jgi:hypothetical protein